MALTEAVMLEVKRGQFEVKDADWEVKSAAMMEISRIFADASQMDDDDDESGSSRDECFGLETWRCLRLPLQSLLKDVRPQLVKEACAVVTEISQACNSPDGSSRPNVAKDGARPLLRDIFPTLLEMLSSGNKVNARFVDDCIRSLIVRCRFKQIVGGMSEYAHTPKGKSTAVREACAVYAKQIIEVWGAPYLSRHEADLLVPLHFAIEKLVEDSSEKARALARAAFAVFSGHWPERAEAITEATDPRAARLLREYLVDLPERPATAPPAAPEPRKSPSKKTARPRTGRPRSPKSAPKKVTGIPRPRSTRRTATLAEDEAPPDLALGDRVKVQRSKLGTVRFVGATQFAAGMWVGVELDARDGNHDGLVGTTRYFECEAPRGLFVRPSQVLRLAESELACEGELSRACSAAAEHRQVLGELFDELQAQLGLLGTHEQSTLTLQRALDYTAAVAKTKSRLGAILDAHATRFADIKEPGAQEDDEEEDSHIIEEVGSSRTAALY